MQTWNGGVAGHIELSDGGYQEVCGELIFFMKFASLSAIQGHLDLPLLLLVVPAGFLYGRVEPDVLVEAMFLSNIGEVCLQVCQQHICCENKMTLPETPPGLDTLPSSRDVAQMNSCTGRSRLHGC